LEVNEALADEAQRINADPYGCWIYRIRAQGPVEGLLDATAYRAKIG
jgi:glycine cleavage system H protein